MTTSPQRGRGRDEGHGPSESGPPGGLVEVLMRWEGTGGRWEVVSSRADWVEISLLPGDGGAAITRVSGARTSVLRAYLAGRTRSAEQ